MTQAASSDELQDESSDKIIQDLAALIECEDVSIEGISKALVEIVTEHKKLSADMEAILSSVGCAPENVVDAVEEAVENAEIAGELQEAFERVQDALGISDVGMALVKHSADPVGTLRKEMRIAPRISTPLRPRMDVCREVMSKLVAGLDAASKAPTPASTDQTPLKLV